MKAEYTGQQVALSWEIPETSSPAFAYKIEVFDNPACNGTPKAIAEERLPSARRAIVDAAVKTPTVRLTMSDVFDQPAPAVTVAATETRLTATPPAPAKTIAGLSYELYQSPKKDGGTSNQSDGSSRRNRGSEFWQKLAELSDGKLVGQGLARGFDLSVNESLNAGYALVFSGLLRAPADGIYIFYGQIDGAYPKPEITSASFGDGTGRVTLTVDGRGHTVNKAAIYLGNFKIAEGSGAEVKYEGPLPKGTNTFWCRVIYDGNRSVDLNSGTLVVTGQPYSPEWTVRNIGEQAALAGLWQTGPQAFSFFGNGMHAVVKSVTGDFTATCRIDSYSSTGDRQLARLGRDCGVRE